MFETPVVDRTPNDVKQVENRINNPKGALSHTMLNRIEKNSHYLAALLNSYDYNVEIEVKTDWTREDYFRPSDLDRIKRNVTALKDAYYSLPTTPSLAAGKKTINYVDANNLEQIEKDLDELIDYMENNFIYCGVPNSGQERLWQQRFRKLKTWNSQPYKLSQYLSKDQLKMIATDNGINHESSTRILGITQIGKRDDVFASIESTNNSMKKIDDLVGFEAREYKLTNLVKAVSDETFVIDGGSVVCEKSTVHVKYGSNSLLITGDEGDSEKYGVSTTSYPLEPTHLYYACVEVYSETGTGSIDFFWKSASPSFFGGKKVYANTWTKWSVVSNRSNFTAGSYPYRLDYNNGGVADKAWFDGAMIIDLTATFGAGNEPTQDWCDKNIPYFTGTYIYKEPVEPYTEIEYLQSSGTQYIDTGYYPNGNTKIVIDFQMINQGEDQQAVFGARGGSDTQFGIFAGYGADCVQTDYYTNAKLNGWRAPISGLNLNNRNIIEVSNELKINGKVINSTTVQSFSVPYTMYLFTYNRMNDISMAAAMKVFSWKIYDNGTLIQYLVPVKDKNGTFCMFDRVSKNFFYNVGTGSFGGA